MANQPAAARKLACVVLRMVGALLSILVMAGSIRELAKGDLSIFDILTIRSAFGYAITTIMTKQLTTITFGIVFWMR